MWRILQQEQTGDYVFATNEMHTVRDFCAHAFAAVDLPLSFEGDGVNELGRDAEGVVRVRVNPAYFRPTEVEHLIGNPEKAKRELGWQPQVAFAELVKIMAEADWELARRERA